MLYSECDGSEALGTLEPLIKEAMRRKEFSRIQMEAEKKGFKIPNSAYRPNTEKLAHEILLQTSSSISIEKALKNPMMFAASCATSFLFDEIEEKKNKLISEVYSRAGRKSEEMVKSKNPLISGFGKAIDNTLCFFYPFK